MRRRYRTASLLAVVLSASSCGISLQSMPKFGGVSGPTYTVKATFANVVNLPANAEVRVGAFSVGYVTDITARDFKAEVTMKIKDKTQLPPGTTAAIHFDTPLGEDFVLLQPPANPVARAPLSNGSAIPESQTNTAPSVEDTFGALGALLNGGGINQLQTIISQTNLALDNNTDKIRSLITSLDATVTSLAQNTPSLDKALTAIATLSKTLHDNSTSITNGIDSLGPAAEILAAETGDINKLLTQVNDLSTVATNIIQASAAGTVRTVQALQPLLGQLTAVQSQLGPALDAITGLEANTPKIVPGNYLQLAINATIEVPAVPAGAPPLQKVTVDPPDRSLTGSRAEGIAALIEGGLP